MLTRFHCPEVTDPEVRVPDDDAVAGVGVVPEEDPTLAAPAVTPPVSFARVLEEEAVVWSLTLLTLFHPPVGVDAGARVPLAVVVVLLAGAERVENGRVGVDDAVGAGVGAVQLVMKVIPVEAAGVLPLPSS